MTDTATLLDHLMDWLRDYDPAGKTYGHFNHEMATGHPELMQLISSSALSEAEMQSLSVIMSTADARGYLQPEDAGADDLIRSSSTPP